MKTFIIISLLSVSGCALYHEIVTPAKPRVQKPIETGTVLPPKTTTTYEDAISKNWEYRRQMGSYVAVTNSLDGKASLTLLRDTGARLTSGMTVPGTKMKYSEGHSVEIKVDDQYSLLQLKASENEGDTIMFADAWKLAESLKGKKKLTIEVLNEEGPKKYTFDISGLQDFFTTI